MFTKIKHFIYLILFHSGLVYVFRFVYRKIFNNPVKILYTHRIIHKSDDFYPFLMSINNFTVEEFKKKINYLLKHYRFISFDECLNHLKIENRPSNCVVLTFDDGYKSIYTRAFPFLKKHNIPATIFLAAGFIENKKMLWHDKLIYLIGKTQVKQFMMPELSEKIYKISTPREKKTTFNDINSCLKTIGNDLKDEIIEKMFGRLGVNRGDTESKNLMLSWGEIREMRDSGLISFGAHTMSHPILTRISLEDAKYEIEQSKKIIEEKLGTPVRFFCYPNGEYEDFNENIKNRVSKNEYLCACTTISNNNGKLDLFALGRDGFTKEPFYMFGLRMGGLFNLLNLRKGKRG